MFKTTDFIILSDFRMIIKYAGLYDRFIDFKESYGEFDNEYVQKIFKSEEVFRQVNIVDGNLYWEVGVDFEPEQLYDCTVRLDLYDKKK